jgi:hypothetical protein
LGWVGRVALLPCNPKGMEARKEKEPTFIRFKKNIPYFNLIEFN